MESTQKSVQYKLFAGFRIDSELRDMLTKSKKWKEASIDKKITPLQEIKHEEHFFIGHYLDSPTLSLEGISLLEEHLSSELKKICPDFTPAPLSLRFFSQPFIQ